MCLPATVPAATKCATTSSGLPQDAGVASSSTLGHRFCGPSSCHCILSTNWALPSCWLYQVLLWEKKCACRGTIPQPGVPLALITITCCSHRALLCWELPCGRPCACGPWLSSDAHEGLTSLEPRDRCCSFPSQKGRQVAVALAAEPSLFWVTGGAQAFGDLECRACLPHVTEETGTTVVGD